MARPSKAVALSLLLSRHFAEHRMAHRPPHRAVPKGRCAPFPKGGAEASWSSGALARSNPQQHLTEILRDIIVGKPNAIDRWTPRSHNSTLHHAPLRWSAWGSPHPRVSVLRARKGQQGYLVPIDYPFPLQGMQARGASFL